MGPEGGGWRRRHNGCLSGGLGEAGRQGVKNQNVEDISSQQIDTGPLILGSLFSPPPPSGHDLHCKWRFCRTGLFFLESKKNPSEKGEIGGSHNTQALLSKLITSQTPPQKHPPVRSSPLPGPRPRSQDPTTAASPSLPGLCSLTGEASTTGSLFVRERRPGRVGPLRGVFSHLRVT